MRVVLIGFIALFSGGSTAGLTRGQMLGLNALGVQMACLQQGPEYRDNELARMVESRPGFEGWQAIDSSSVAQCLKKRRWLSTEFCNDLLKVDVFDSPALADVLKKHENALPAADVAVSYVNEAKAARLDSKPEPSCPDMKALPSPAESSARDTRPRSPPLSRAEQEAAWKKSSAEREARWAAEDKVKATYAGRYGREARQMLGADGYDCQLVVHKGSRVDTDSGMPVGADLPSYRCIKDKEVPAACTCVVVRLQLGPQATSKSVAEYQAAVDSLTLSDKDIDAHCASGPSACWRPN